MRYADLLLYALAAAVPVLLLALFSLFRWRYLRAVARAIYTEAPASSLASDASPGSLPHQPLILVSENRGDARIAAGPELLVARREEAAYRTALALSGLLFVALAALVTYWGQRHQGTRAAVSIAYSCTLPGLLLIAVFVRRAWIAVIGAVTIWLAVGLLLHVVWLRISVRDTLLLPATIEVVGPPTLTAGLLALRAARPILVGFVPLVLVWLVTCVAGAAALDAVGITLEGGFTPRAIAGASRPRARAWHSPSGRFAAASRRGRSCSWSVSYSGVRCSAASTASASPAGW